jgi:hypothetical protein
VVDDGWPETEEEWDALRAYFDDIGHKQALDAVVAKGVSPEIAGQRIAHFNDILIERLKQEANERRTRPDSGAGP